MNNILNNSKVGKNTIEQLKKQNDKIQKNFKGSELKLGEEEKNIFLKKKILSKDQFNKEIQNLKKKITLYNNNKNKILNEQNQKKINSQKKIVDILNPILIKYMEEKSITIIFKKDSMIVAPKELNITDEIIDRLNKKITKLEL